MIKILNLFHLGCSIQYNRRVSSNEKYNSYNWHLHNLNGMFRQKFVTLWPHLTKKRQLMQIIQQLLEATNRLLNIYIQRSDPFGI